MAKKGKYSGGTDSSGSLVTGLVVVMGILVLFSLGLRLVIGSAGSSQPQLEATTAPTQEITPDVPAETQPEKQSLWSRLFGSKKSEEPAATQPEETEATEATGVVAQATIAVTGDILMHLPVTNTGLRSDGTYNFDSIFQYLKPYSSAADYAVANLETTLAGTDMGYKYSGHPAFNTPDAIVDALKDAGFDMLLTANNHCYDTSEYGFLRTIQTVKSKGLTPLGTRENAADPAYSVQNIGGIQVGMVCYSYEGQPENPSPGVVYMNMNALSANCSSLINAFIPTNLETFYQQVRQQLAQMKLAGAEATVMFIHWGEEYQTSPNAVQQEIAQKLCDLGIDVIVGGHPHVVEPVALLSSTVDPDHKTVCLYSMGNAVSNQRANVMKSQPNGYTEDGVWFTMTFCKYSDGTVYLEDVNLIPTWVYLRTTNGRRYDILPLDDATRDQWAQLYDLQDVTVSAAQRSYNRTMSIVGDGLAESQQYLASAREQRDANYLAALMEQLYGNEAA